MRQPEDLTMQERAMRRALELDERSWIGLLQRTILEVLGGRVTAALSSAEEAYAIAPWSSAVVGIYAGALARNGQTTRAEELVQTLGDGEAPGAALGLMQHYLLREDIDRAAHWTRRGIEQRDLVIPFILRHPIADELRASSHWAGLSQMMNLSGTAS